MQSIDRLFPESATPPADYAVQLETAAPGVTQIIQQSASESRPWTETLMSLLPQLAATYQQRQILEVQVERARQGLPPLDAAQYAAGVQVGMSDDTKKLVYVGIGALLIGAFLLSRR